MRRRFLFVLWEGGGNVPPALAIASRLVGRGHDVRVLSDPSIGEDAGAAGASFVPFQEAPHRTSRTPESEIIRDWAARTAYGAFARARDRHAFRPAALFAKETRRAAEHHGTDAVVVDAMLFGGLVGAEATGKPWAAVIPMTSFLPAPGRPPPALGLAPARGVVGRSRDRALTAFGDRLLWRSCLHPLNVARQGEGLAPVAHPLDQVRRADRVLVLTSPAFDWDAPPARGNVVYTGPELDDPAWAHDALEPTGEGPVVLVALSTTYQGQTELLGRILRGLAGMSVRVVATVGPAIDPSSVSAPPNATVVGAASHSALLRVARLVVTHGGHGTVLRALAAGVPLVVLPMGRDQADNAVRVVRLGAGVRLSPRSGVGRLTRTIDAALTDASLLAGARAFAAKMRTERARDLAVETLEQLGGAR